MFDRRAPLAVALLMWMVSVASPVVGQSLTLDGALARARASSPSIAEAEAGVAAARGRAVQAGVSPNPELQVSIENVAGSGVFRGIGGAELTVGIAQRFELGGKRRARRSLALAEIKGAQLRLARAGADLELRVRQAFADLLAAQERVALTRRNAELAETLAATASTLVAAGRDPPLRALRARSAAIRARADVFGAEAILQVARQAVATSLGITDTLAAAETQNATPVVTPVALEDALDVRLAVAEVRIAQARVALEESTRVSDVTAQAGVRRLNETDDTALVVGFAIPLAIRDRNRGGIAASRFEEVAAQARLAQARLDAAAGLSIAQTNVAAVEAQVAALERSGIIEAREAVRLADLGYRAGKFGLIDVLDAQRALNEAENGLLDARLARARALAALARAAAR